jgi:hypothetical protein
MKFTAMDSIEGNELVERIIDAAAKMHVMQGATTGEAQSFMKRSILTLSCAEGFEEADRGEVYFEAVCRFCEVVDQYVTAMSFS